MTRVAGPVVPPSTSAAADRTRGASTPADDGAGFAAALDSRLRRDVQPRTDDTLAAHQHPRSTALRRPATRAADHETPPRPAGEGAPTPPAQAALDGRDGAPAHGVHGAAETDAHPGTGPSQQGSPDGAGGLAQAPTAPTPGAGSSSGGAPSGAVAGAVGTGPVDRLPSAPDVAGELGTVGSVAGPAAGAARPASSAGGGATRAVLDGATSGTPVAGAVGEGAGALPVPTAPGPAATATATGTAVDTVAPHPVGAPHGTPATDVAGRAQPDGDAAGTAGAAAKAATDASAAPVPVAPTPVPAAAATPSAPTTQPVDTLVQGVTGTQPAPTSGTQGAAPVASLAAPTVPVPPVQAQVLAAVSPLLRGPDGSHRLTLQLAPEHLGRVRVEITVSGAEVALHLVAADAVTRETLRHGLAELRSQLEQSGLRTTEVDVRQGTPDQGGSAGADLAASDHQPSPKGGHGAVPGRGAQGDPRVGAPVPRPATPDVGLDVRM
jgi:hypothetical protein